MLLDVIIELKLCLKMFLFIRKENKNIDIYKKKLFSYFRRFLCDLNILNFMEL